MAPSGTPNQPARFKSPQRLTVTLAHAVYERLVMRSSSGGRSISNLAAYLIEESLAREK